MGFTGAGPGCGWGSKVRYRTTGTAPNRIFCVEWWDMEINSSSWNAQGNRGRFQVQLHESGRIIFYYYKMESSPTCGYWGGTATISGSIGLAKPGGEFLSVTPTAAGMTTSTSSANNSITLAGSTALSAGRAFTFDKLPEVRLTSSPKTLNYGVVGGGTTVDLPVTVQHVGSEGTLVINSTTLSGPGASQYQVMSTPGPLAIGQTGTIVVRFAPNVNGTHVAKLTITSNGVDSGVQDIDLIGVALAPSIQIIPIDSGNTATKMFRKKRVVVADSLDEAFLVKNVGDANLLLNPASPFVGADPDMYSFAKLPTGQIAPQQQDTVRIRFKPRREGGLNATLQLMSNAANGTQNIDFNGIGIVPRLEIVQGEFMTIDSIPIGTRVCKNIDLYNPGSAPLTLTKNYLSSADGDFEYTPLTGSDTIIAPLSTKTVQICITGLQKGTRRARLRFTTNIPLTYPEFGPRQDTSVKQIDIWAGVVPVDLSKVAIKPFGPENIVDQPVTTTIDITNAGSELAEYEAPIFSGSGKDVFTVTSGTFPMQIAPGKTASFTVQALPKTRGLHTADLTINWKSDDREHVINGEIAVEAVIACSQASADQDFGKLLLGEETIKQIEISNCGDIAQTYTASLTGEGFRLVSEPVSSEIASGEKAIYTVAFSPSKEGNFAGGLRISGKHVADMNVALTGLGEKPVVASVSNSSEQSGYVLYQNIPNPSTNMTTIRFTLPKSTYVKVGLTDVTGKFVKAVASGMYTEGTNFISMTTNDLASGTYIYTLEADGVRLSRQISVTK
jgi:hypothetical protein